MGEKIILNNLTFEKDTLLFPKVSGECKSKIRNEDIIVTRHDGREVEYLVYKINYNGNIFEAQLIFLKFND